jgi:transglutaminase-like putative cysteine protease
VTDAPASRALVAAMYVLVADGLIALHLGGLLGELGVLVTGAAATASLWQARLRAPLARIRGGATVPGVMAAVAALVDVLYLAPTALDGLIHLLLFLLFYRLFTRTTLRDVRDIGFVSFFMLVAAAPGTFDVGFLFVFVTFLAAGTAMLMLRHVLGESARPDDAATFVAGASPILARHIVSLTAVATASTLVITATLFFVIPRIGQAALPFRAKAGRMVSGFSERVSLGAFGEIETDGAVAMRVHVPDTLPSPEVLPGLRWRGIALDHFDGRAWTRREPHRFTVRRTSRGTFDVGRPRGAGVLLTQEIYLEPLGTDVLFGAPHVLRLAVRADMITADGAGSLAVPMAAARLQYVVESELEPVAGARSTARPVALDDDERGRYLQLPPMAPRVTALARQATAGARDPFDAAQRLSAHLATQYRYSRVLERKTDLPAVEEFLFVTRAGNCEYFAASLAVMLRALGIPARVVNGFQRGEWNPYGRYFMVRLLDAHSWVEAHFDDTGWVTLDPSPRGDAAATAGPGSVSLYLDALRMRWYRYVVNWSLNDQIEAAGTVRRAARSWSFRIEQLAPRAELGTGALVAVGVVAGAVAIALIGRRARAGADRGAHAMPRFYERALHALARRGLAPEADETAREFAERVSRAAPAMADPFARVTIGYERTRFGGQTLAAEELRGLERSVAALAASAPAGA